MAMTTHELPPLRSHLTWQSGEPHRQVKLRLANIAKETGRFLLVLGIFGGILIATMALRLAIWVPFLHR